ncbi:NAD-dependent epimerase/dehydratase family protein [Fulvivirga sp. M361]|uniref:NAD-dependent epimerase/dehydratase family protein n=1 Tax=Fulvivirga sp. M361 TaxID=2594266 RepID=UPI00117AC30B|nr:NAD-dependent epimerase/dehydratase family protein [Fulvivirga sp. M361]TRX55560.1 NAD-dependent epimerase/dehydratase family protein [Fulvivirga sp. M361]
MSKVLVIGAFGQLGSELTTALRNIYGDNNVVASDLKEPQDILSAGPTEQLDVRDKQTLSQIVDKHGITQIYHLAAILSAKGESDPKFAWQLNMDSLINVLELAREKQLDKIFWPSSIAVFGPGTPKQNTPQDTVMDPNTIYGISKLAGERWCAYYFEKYGVDVRSLRYPGLIGYKAKPGGGTTDYAVDIFYQAIEHGTYECFLKSDTYLPMMYMSDAIKATIELMEADRSKVKVRSSYNVSALSFSPDELKKEIEKFIPEFSMSYRPDFRQEIAESWPSSIDDTEAREDWGWQHDVNLNRMTQTMLDGLRTLANH